MKRILLSLAALAAIFPAARAQLHADTLIVYRPDKVTVITSAETQEIRIKGSDQDPDYNYVGRITLTPDATVAVQDGPYLFGFDIFKIRKKSPASVQRKRSRISTEGLERVSLGFTDALESPGGAQLAPRVFSDLELSMLNLHFRPFREVLEFSTGIDLGYRALALSGGNQFVLRDGIVCSLAIGLPMFAYVKYSPCPVLAEGKGPSFHTLSFGLSLILSEW